MGSEGPGQRRSFSEDQVEAEVERRVKNRQQAREEIMEMVSEVVSPVATELKALGAEVKRNTQTLSELQVTAFERAQQMAERLGVWRGTAEERETLHRIIVQELARPIRQNQWSFRAVVLGMALAMLQILEVLLIAYLALVGVSHPVLGR